MHFIEDKLSLKTYTITTFSYLNVVNIQQSWKVLAKRQVFELFVIKDLELRKFFKTIIFNNRTTIAR